MLKLEDYAKKYSGMTMKRRNGILEWTLETKGGWNHNLESNFCFACADIGADPETKVVILTGAGDNFFSDVDYSSFDDLRSPRGWDKIHWAGRRLLLNFLDIDVPIIAAVNGPAFVHAEIAVLCDIVLASETAAFRDAGHFKAGVVPGDGVHVVWPMVLGMNRGRYFLLTGQELSAQEALDLGVVNEVLPPAELMGRAWELAEDLAEKPPLTLRYSRILMTQEIKRRMGNDLGYGLALEGLAAIDESDMPG